MRIDANKSEKYPITENLKTLSNVYLEHTGKPMSAIAREIVGSGDVMAKIVLSGRQVQVNTAYKILWWFADNWPADLHWPKLEDMNVRPPARHAARKQKSSK